MHDIPYRGVEDESVDRSPKGSKAEKSNNDKATSNQRKARSNTHDYSDGIELIFGKLCCAHVEGIP